MNWIAAVISKAFSKKEKEVKSAHGVSDSSIFSVEYLECSHRFCG